VVVVADLKPERQVYIRNRYPKIHVTHDFRELFEMDLDAAVIATPPATHYELARSCLEHDLHVMVEKPMTLNSRDAEVLVALADERARVLMVGHTFEYNPAVLALKELIESGEMGEIYYLDAARLNLGLFQNDTNALWDLAPHDISILLYLLEKEPLTVRACGATCVLKGIHDVVYIHLDFANCVSAHIHVSWLDPCKVRRITVVGSRKMAVYNDVENLEKIKIYDRGVEIPDTPNNFGEIQCSYRYGDILIPNIRFSEPLRMECQHFLDCITNHTRPRSDGRSGLNVVKIIEAAQKSLINGGEEILINPTPIQQIAMLEVFL
jgi:predicted dehydrogenase